MRCTGLCSRQASADRERVVARMVLAAGLILSFAIGTVAAAETGAIMPVSLTHADPG